MHADIIKRLVGLTGPDREADLAITNLLDKHPHGWSYIWGAQAIEPGSKEIAVIDLPDEYEYLREEYLYDRDGPSLVRPKSYTASLDAAIALVERVLPGESVLIGWGQTTETLPWARVGIWSGADATGPNRAIALLIAMFKALDARARQENER